MVQLSLPPNPPTQSRSWNLGFFSPAHSVLGQEEGLCWVIVQTATSVLSGPSVQSALWDRWDRSQWLRLHPGKKSEYWMYDPVLSFSSQGEAGSFLPIIWHFARGSDYGKRVSQIFLSILMWLVSHTLGVQKPLNWFLDFSQRELVCVLLIWCACWRKEGPELAILPFC